MINDILGWLMMVWNEPSPSLLQLAFRVNKTKLVAVNVVYRV